MKINYYSLSFRTDEKTARALIQLVVSDPALDNFNFHKVDEGGDEKKPSHRRKPNNKNGSKQNGPQALLKIIQSHHPIERDAASEELVKLGYSASSIVPFASRLYRDGLIERRGKELLLTLKGGAK